MEGDLALALAQHMPVDVDLVATQGLRWLGRPPQLRRRSSGSALGWRPYSAGTGSSPYSWPLKLAWGHCLSWSRSRLSLLGL